MESSLLGLEEDILGSISFWSTQGWSGLSRRTP